MFSLTSFSQEKIKDLLYKQPDVVLINDMYLKDLDSISKLKNEKEYLIIKFRDCSRRMLYSNTNNLLFVFKLCGGENPNKNLGKWLPFLTDCKYS
jgi:hypothetical protein